MYRAARSFSTTVARKDLVRDSFLKKVREFGQKGADLINTDPAVKKGLQDELNRVSQKYNLTPEQAAKLSVTLSTQKVESSLAHLLEGQSLQQLLDGVKKEEKDFLAAQAARRAEEAKKAAALAAKA